MSSAKDLTRTIIDPSPTANVDWTCHVTAKGNVHTGLPSNCTCCRPFTDGDTIKPHHQYPAVPATEPVYETMADYREDGSIYVEYSDGTSVDCPDRAHLAAHRQWLKDQSVPATVETAPTAAPVAGDDTALDRCGMTGGIRPPIKRGARVVCPQRFVDSLAATDRDRRDNPFAAPSITNREARDRDLVHASLAVLLLILSAGISVWTVLGVLSLIDRSWP